MESPNEFSGSLKQQCLDESGLYEWVRKSFTLKIEEGSLEIYPSLTDREPQSQLSLTAARHAKEWSISSAIAGYGFDIVWASGKMWSFLADNESACQNWVMNINRSIKISVKDLNKAVDVAVNKSGEDFRNILGIPKFFDDDGVEGKYDYTTGRKQDIDTYHEMISKLPTDESRRRYATNDNDTTAEFQSPIRGMKQNPHANGGAPPTVPRYSAPAARNQATSTPKAQTSSSRGRLNISEIPVVDSASDRSSPQAPSLSDVEQESLHEDRSAIAESKRIRFVGGGQGAADDHQDLHVAEDLEVSALRLRCNQLTLTAESDRAESEKVRRQVLVLQEELQESLFALEKNAHALRQRERESYQAAQLDTHAKIVRATDERDILHEAIMRAAQEQYSREMASLRDELTEARKRYGEELTKVGAIRDAAEGREMELLRENASIRDANSRLTADRVRAAESSHTDAASWSKERESIITAADARIAALEDEREALIARGQSELSHKINELTLKFGASTSDMERSVRETMMQEMAGEKIREMAAMQKKCSRDVQVARTDEKRLASKEVETVRNFFLEREGQTAEDLSELEKLHDGRIARLEQQLAVSKKRAAAAEDSLDVAVREMDKGAEGSKSTTGKYFKQLEESARKADGLAEELESAHSELQESRVRESVYREQLARVLEDARVKNAMLLEAQRQASEGSSQAYQWRKAVAVIDSNQSATTTKLQISRDEIAMLEHDLKRLKIENTGLRKSLEKAEMLVYGTVQHVQVPQETGGSKRPKSASNNVSFSKLRNSLSVSSRSGHSHSSHGGGGGDRGAGEGVAYGASRASHPPWRSGVCNCSCKASWCRCLGHGASVTS